MRRSTVATAATIVSLAFVPSVIAAATIQDPDPRLEAMKIEALPSLPTYVRHGARKELE